MKNVNCETCETDEYTEVLKNEDGEFFVWCGLCEQITKKCASMEQALRAWNKRDNNGSNAV